MRPLTRLLRLFFRLLYQPLARTYDLVAWTVSLGRWKDWVESVVPFIQGTRVLELGHGPGHLQRILRSLNLLAVGLDESRQMGRLAKSRLSQHGYTQINLTRGLAQSLPFAADTFDTVVATFPTEYFVDPRSLAEVRRTLTNGGRFIVLPVAWLTGTGPLDRFAAWLFRVTGQAPSEFSEEATARLIKPFAEAGFQVETEQLVKNSSRVLIVIATEAK